MHVALTPDGVSTAPTWMLIHMLEVLDIRLAQQSDELFDNYDYACAEIMAQRKLAKTNEHIRLIHEELNRRKP